MSRSGENHDLWPLSLEQRTHGADRPKWALGLMTKYWAPGQVKTRLASSTGDHRAAHLHAAFVSHLCRTLNQYPARKMICLTPWNQHRKVQSFLRDSDGDRWEIVPQAEGDLGARMEDWFAQALAEPTEIAILIGSDCPTISARDLDRSVLLLQTHDVVLGPAADGGYFLIGLKGCWADRKAAFVKLFKNVAWSSDRVLQQTCQRADDAGLVVAKLAPQEDIDTIDELRRLRDHLGKLPSSQATSDQRNLAAKIESIMNNRSLDATCSPEPGVDLP